MVVPPTPGLMLVIMENQQSTNILGNQNAPNLTGLAQTYPIATRYFGATHPSLPNYLMLWAGSTFGVKDDGLPAVHALGGDNLGTQLDQAGISWSGYFESLVDGADPTVDSGPLDASGEHLYVAHHNPIVYFASYDRAKVKSFSALVSDLDGEAPPGFALVVPDMADNMHDPVGSTAADSQAVQAGDRWFQALFDTVTGTKWWTLGGTILLTWDEAYNGSGQTVPGGIGTPPTDGGPVILMILSSKLAHVGPWKHGLGGDGNWDGPLTHAGLLGSIETYFGVKRLNDSANSSYGDISPLLIGSTAAPGS